MSTVRSLSHVYVPLTGPNEPPGGAATSEADMSSATQRMTNSSGMSAANSEPS